MRLFFSALVIQIATSAMTFSAETPQPGKQVAQSIQVNASAGAEKLVEVPYLLFLPESYGQEKDKQWPLMLFLHGLGESGDGQLDRVQKHGPPKLVARQRDFPFVLVSPQCPRPQDGYRDAWQADQLIQLVDAVVDAYEIDQSRLYVTGLSMGGYGTWRLAATHPNRFAAAAPVCGGGKPAYAPALAKLPIWAFHGARDNVVPISESQQMVAAVEKAGGDVRLTTYPEARHDSWTATYQNPKLYQWLLKQRNTGR